jgi:hypothetical protein
MSDFDNIGKLMHLPLTSIQVAEDELQNSNSDFEIAAATDCLLESKRGNWIPVIVRETSDYKYEVVSQSFVYLVAQNAGLERLWCIVIEPSDREIEQAKILAQETIPKVNLNTASRDTILNGLKHLISQPNSPLKGVDPVVAADKISQVNRTKWNTLTAIPNLKCGITKGKKLDALNRVFFVSAPPPITPPPAPPIISIKTASIDNLLERLNYLSKYEIEGFESVNVELAAEAIFTTNKAKWKSLNPIIKLECGINAKQIRTLKTIFCL